MALHVLLEICRFLKRSTTFLATFRAFPKALTTSFPVRSNQQAFHKVVTCRTASVSPSDDVFTWDDVVTISKPVQISGATRKRSKSAIALSLESHSEFLPFVIEDHSQRKIKTLMAVAFIAEHRTRAVEDVIKSLGEEHSPVILAILICMMNGNWLIGLIGAMYESSSASTWRFLLAFESGRFFNGHAYGVHMNGYVEKDGKKFLWIEKGSQQKPIYIIYIQGCLII
ncbi:unnamed protein product [Prunus brigantina]